MFCQCHVPSKISIFFNMHVAHVSGQCERIFANTKS